MSGGGSRIPPEWMRRRIAISWIARTFRISGHEAAQELLAVTEELRDEPSNFRLGLGAQLQAGPIETWEGIERKWSQWTVRLFVEHRLARGDGWEGGEGRQVIARKFGVPHLYEEEDLRILSRIPAIPLEVRWSVLRVAVDRRRKAAAEAKGPVTQTPPALKKITDTDIKRFIEENAAADGKGLTSAKQLTKDARKWYADNHFIFGGHENWNQLLDDYPQLRRTAGNRKTR